MLNVVWKDNDTFQQKLIDAIYILKDTSLAKGKQTYNDHFLQQTNVIKTSLETQIYSAHYETIQFSHEYLWFINFVPIQFPLYRLVLIWQHLLFTAINYTPNLQQSNSLLIGL